MQRKICGKKEKNEEMENNKGKGLIHGKEDKRRWKREIAKNEGR